jgi:hypothetical protein
MSERKDSFMKSLCNACEWPLDFANGLWHGVSVVILQVGVRAFITEPHETLVDLVAHTASIG